MGETIKRSKMGRPPLPPGERRGASMGFRPTPQIRAKLEQAAHENGRSMSQEVEARLEASFLDEEARDREMGGKELHALFRLLGAAAEIIEARTGKICSEDWDTGMAVFSAWQRLLVDAMPKTPAAMQKTIQILAGPTEELSVPDLAQVRQLLNEHPGTEMTDEDLQRIEEAMKTSDQDSRWGRTSMYEPEHFIEAGSVRDPFPQRQIPEPPPTELYNIAVDRLELDNVAEANPDRVRRMLGQLEGWFEEVESERATIADAW